ncbi:uncharacterized protein K452DRAFT_282607 [Aplosporella prunicola CBS 121167]|uniref:Uncharacterized protein n=1 Tax=Aplosporella prunicola CBS 121167 TaxID=1176127 RepID=A0A6A6BT45_9PEZI|nr:uncharacterized protein K452DRAFT_282607 [Aplosporella prunicola CBS 121167]KAF2146435.1 hypothetical protein K452DRAFT_282607 [Aplosporella prunicola CBS 121167]
MDHLIQAFSRVVRNLDNFDSLSQIISDLENSPTIAVSLSTKDRYRILDFPDPDDKAKAIVSSSCLSRSALFRRAAKTPVELTDSELELLRTRYWLDITPDGFAAARAHEALSAVSMDHWTETTERLKRVRQPLYEENEEAAIENACAEFWRRANERWQMRQQQEAETALARPNAKEWVKRLWEEEKGKAWGFAIFIDPEIDERRREDCMCRVGAALLFATGAVGMGETIEAWRQLHSAEWPGNVGNEVKFGSLRKKFREIRDGLPEGILKNVVLVVDYEVTEVVLETSRGNVDDMWVWAVDPDYTETEGKGDGYEGFLRVRWQQLVNNFFEARRFHEDEFPMEKLWEKAQNSRNQAFVSVKDEEIGLWIMSRSAGSALRTS